MLAYVLIFRVDLGALGRGVCCARAGATWQWRSLLAMAGVALRAVRWLVLLRAPDIDVPLGRLVRLYYVGTFFNIFLLSGFGGDAIRMIELARHSQKTPEAIGTVLVDRATGLWVLFVHRAGGAALCRGARCRPRWSLADRRRCRWWAWWAAGW